MQLFKTAPAHSALDAVLDAADQVILGKGREIRLAVCCLLAGGHLLIEDLPGVGKTTLAQLLARLLGLEFSRIQFTSDMLPADIIGVSIYERSAESFRFHAGPVFAQVVLADEINRATPKAQSALLEAMEEHQITVEGETRPLPSPFFVIATQNPHHQVGTFPLPESQLDRFLMRIRLGYPAAHYEKKLLAGEDRRALLQRVAPMVTPQALNALQGEAARVHLSPAIVDYCHAILSFTRGSSRFAYGLSPRAGLGLLHAARAWALLAGRDYVLPEDLQTVLPACAPHRLADVGDAATDVHEDIAEYILARVPIP